MNLKQLQEKILEEFNKQFPRFKGVGARFPMFEETPVYTHIEQFIFQSIQQAAEEHWENVIIKEKQHAEYTMSSSPEHEIIFNQGFNEARDIFKDNHNKFISGE